MIKALSDGARGGLILLLQLLRLLLRLLLHVWMIKALSDGVISSVLVFPAEGDGGGRGVAVVPGGGGQRGDVDGPGGAA